MNSSFNSFIHSTRKTVSLAGKEGLSLSLGFEFMLLPFHITNPNISGIQGCFYPLSSCFRPRGTLGVTTMVVSVDGHQLGLQGQDFGPGGWCALRM